MRRLKGVLTLEKRDSPMPALGRKAPKLSGYGSTTGQLTLDQKSALADKLDFRLGGRCFIPLHIGKR